MDIQFYGANCVTISTKQARVVVDDRFTTDKHAKPVAKPGDIMVFTGAHDSDQKGAKIVIDQPGEYEVSGISIDGIAARAHLDEVDQQSVTVYKILADDVRILIIGHVYPELTDEQLEEIGTVDLMVVPVGGNGYTLDGIGALEIIKKVEPKLIIPTHYADPSITFPVSQQTLPQALKELGMEPQETTPRLHLKALSLNEDSVMQLIILERTV
jgi:L-ascorbate metabolism protein UlaG (beta-lactamase superfamily)